MNAPFQIEKAIATVEGIGCLKTGDIIGCVMPAVINGDIKFIDRACLLLGIEADKDRERVHSLVLARFAFPQDRLTSDRGLVLERDLLSMNDIPGLRRDTVLRHNRIDLIPVDPFYLGPKIDRIGFVRDPYKMNTIGAWILKGLRGPLGEGSQGPQGRTPGTEIRQTPAPRTRPVFVNFPLQKIIDTAESLPMQGETDYQRAVFQRRINEKRACAEAHNAFLAAVAADPETAQVTAYVTRDEIKRANPKMKPREIDQTVSRLNAQARAHNLTLGATSPAAP